jgi:hypothetical protein
MSETFLILNTIERDITINVYRSPYKVPVVLARFQLTLYFLDRVSKNPQILNSMKILPVGAELFHAHGQRDRHEEAIVAFRNFANGSKNRSILVL